MLILPDQENIHSFDFGKNNDSNGCGNNYLQEKGSWFNTKIHSFKFLSDHCNFTYFCHQRPVFMQKNIYPLLNKILIIFAISMLIVFPASNLFPLGITLLMGGITAILIILLFIVNEYVLMPRYFFGRT